MEVFTTVKNTRSNREIRLTYQNFIKRKVFFQELLYGDKFLYTIILNETNAQTYRYPTGVQAVITDVTPHVYFHKLLFVYL